MEPAAQKDWKGGAMDVNRETLLYMYETMVTIRNLENRLVEEVSAGHIFGAGHSYVGEEAVAQAGVSWRRMSGRRQTQHPSPSHLPLTCQVLSPERCPLPASGELSPAECTRASRRLPNTRSPWTQMSPRLCACADSSAGSSEVPRAQVSGS